MLELLLVLALMVTVAALALPNIGLTLASHRLRAAGEEVRTAWVKARVKAMDTGRTYAFRHEITGNQYVIEPWVQQDDYLESSELTTGGAPLAGAGGTAGNTALSTESAVSGAQVKTLPPDVSFVGSEALQDNRMLVAAQQGGSSLQIDSQWSAPIFFYPDGTTSTARLQLKNQRERMTQVLLRGLTGVASVKEITAQEANLP